MENNRAGEILQEIDGLHCEWCGKPLGQWDKEKFPSYKDSITGHPYCWACWQGVMQDAIPTAYGWASRHYYDLGEELPNPDPTKLYLGIELEVDKGGRNHDVAREVRTILGRNFTECMKDRSVPEGFEIVTCPATLEYHRTVPYKEAFEKLKSYGYVSDATNNSGLHIHASRFYFGQDYEQKLNITKLRLLFDRFWKKYIVPLSRRPAAELEKWSRCPGLHLSTEKLRKRHNVDKIKHIAVNNMHNEVDWLSSVEIRIFEGTLDADVLMAMLEFMDIIVRFAVQMDITDIYHVFWEDIFTLDVRRAHPTLEHYLLERRILR